jgi:hypothetical protein
MKKERGKIVVLEACEGLKLTEFSENYEIYKINKTRQEKNLLRKTVRTYNGYMCYHT